MKIISWLAQYNKALVPLIMAGVYFLNATYGWELPVDEASVVTTLGLLTTILVWAVPNKKVE